jgi:hypothetical protein
MLASKHIHITIGRIEVGLSLEQWSIWSIVPIIKIYNTIVTTAHTKLESAVRYTTYTRIKVLARAGHAGTIASKADTLIRRRISGTCPA